MRGTSNGNGLDLDYTEFQRSLLKDWKRDFDERRPMAGTSRGLFGMAVSIAKGTMALAQGHSLYPDSSVELFGIRDVPKRYFSDMREANIAAVASSDRLRFGAPWIDFGSGDQWDFWHQPFSTAHRRESEWHTSKIEAVAGVLNASNEFDFDVFNRISGSMTRAAYRGLINGYPASPRWFKQGRGQAFDLLPLREWMPEVYLEYAPETYQQMLAFATATESTSVAFECPDCGRCSDIEALMQPRNLGVNLIENGDFVARCPVCARRIKWHVADAFPSHPQRRYNEAFKHDFMQAIASNLPLRISEACTYAGVVLIDRRQYFEGRKLDTTFHRFCSDRGETFDLCVPSWSNVLVKPGQTLVTGQEWIKLLPMNEHEHGLRNWQKLDNRQKQTGLAEVCGGGIYVGFLHQLWFSSQAIRPLAAGGNVLFPARYAVHASRDIKPKSIWWDFRPCELLDDLEAYGDNLSTVYIFPPIVPERWHDFQVNAFDVIGLDFRIQDPRFSLEPRPVSRQRPLNVVDTAKAAVDAVYPPTDISDEEARLFETETFEPLTPKEQQQRAPQLRLLEKLKR